ncbi:T9SS type A sorting domain-containing protein [Flavobacterium sp.]|uniref:T9SS type A sorting domain-containing protein n=1 Tax=Flavobacterium sp. TaxID=239 RepID=UPI00286A15F2|nr:T9SS type A sorting domain-containing protein [Flavobacterium sp.]
MKKITLLFLVLFPNLFYAQPQVIEWQKCFGGTDTDNIFSILQTTDGGYIATGYTRSTDIDAIGNHGNQDILLVKMNAAGTIEWKKTYGGSSSETANAIKQTSDGGYVIAGNTYSTNGDITSNHGNSDAWVLKLSAIGDLEWQKTLGGTSQDNANDVTQTSDGGFIIACDIFSSNGNVTSNHGATDAWIVKLNASGVIDWQKSYGGTKLDIATSIQKTTDGGYIFAAYTNSNDGDVTGNHGTNTTDYWVVKINATGTIEWKKTYGGSNAEEAKSIQQTVDGGYILCGKTTSNDGDVSEFKGSSDYWIVKLNATGTMIWQKAYGGTDEEIPFSIKQTLNGGYVVSGFTHSSDGDVALNHAGSILTNDIWILYLYANGDIQWQTSLGNTGYQDSHDIQQTADGGYIVAGNTGGALENGQVTGFLGGNLDFWVIKLGPAPLNVTTFNDSKIKIYPNPVSDYLVIGAGNMSFSKITVYDLQGRVIKRFQDVSNQINVTDLKRGVYIIEVISANQEVAVAKFSKL